MPEWDLLMRWIHLVAGVTWIGHLYFFNLVNVNFMKSLDAETKSKVVPQLMPRALWWFRWGSVVTVLSGLLLIMSFWGASPSWNFSIVLGGGMGLIMFFNVWVFIWPNQKKVIGIVSATPEEKTKAARVAFLASRTNFYLSFPMLFFMGAAYHYRFI
jgi:uncharacterized membrane protein